MRSDKIIYYLSIRDIQSVAKDNLNRKLTEEEIKKVVRVLGDKIAWYDAIDDSIREEVKI